MMKGSQAGQENLRKFVAWLDRDQTCTKVENARPSSAAASSEKACREGDHSQRTQATVQWPPPLMKQILEALEQLDKRLNLLEAKQAQSENDQSETTSESWQNLSMDGGGK